jgi:tetratricopeptide (TPR) repeat protein
MLSEYPLLAKACIRDKRLENKLAYGFIALYVILSLIYAFSETATWDDDCPSRYYNTLSALQDPGQFINPWNRPLFVLLFFLPVHLGKYAITFGMVAITAVSGLYLYKGLRKLVIPNAWLILPMFFFQTFFFSISRNAETEPLAVALICFGFYFLSQKKWLYFAVAGSLMPLARLELSVILLFWAYELVRNKQFRLLPVLVVPFLLWDIAAGMIEGDYLYLFKKTILADDDVNRYGHTAFGHYFRRYIYVTGPIIYTLFFTGFIARIKKRRFDGFVFFQFITGFLLYVIFSWKLNIGNPAGFLRNLIPLTPLTALLALEGFNHILDLSLSNRGNGQSESRSHDLIWLSSFFILLAILVFFFHSSIMTSHHALSEVNNYVNFYLVVMMAVFFAGIYVLLQKKQLNTIILLFIGLVLSLGMMTFTLISEKPDANNNLERATVKEVSDIYVHSYFEELPTYVNHVWFFWINDLDRLDSKFKSVTVSNLNNARPGSICIYENHYSHRLTGDVTPYYFDRNRSWIEITRRISPDLLFACIIYQKMDTLNPESNLGFFDKYLKDFPDDNFAIIARGNYKNFILKDPEAALIDFEEALSKDPNFYLAYYNRGIAYFYMDKLDLALNDFKRSTQINPKVSDAYINIGQIQHKISQYDSAIVSYNRAIEVSDNFPEAYLNRGITYQELKKYDLAIIDYSKALLLDHWNIKALENRSLLYYIKKKWDVCLADLNLLVKLQPANGTYWYNKAICEHNMKNDAEACKSWNKAYSLGVMKAANSLNNFCK